MNAIVKAERAKIEKFRERDHQHYQESVDELHTHYKEQMDNIQDEAKKQIKVQGFSDRNRPIDSGTDKLKSMEPC